MSALVISPAPRDPRAQGRGVPVVNRLRAPRGLVAAPLFIGRAPYDPVTRRRYATGINPGGGTYPPAYFGEPTRYGFGGRSYYSYWTFTGIGTSTPTKLVQQVCVLTGTSVGNVSLSSRGVTLGINGSGNAYVNLYDGTSKTATGTTTLVATTFYVLTGTWDGSTIRIYLNGVLEASTAAGNPWGGTGTTLRLCDQSGPADGTNGSRLFGAILADNMLWSEGEIYTRARAPWAHLDWPDDQLARDVGKIFTSSAITGSGTITFAAMTAAGTGVEKFSGSGAFTFGAMTAAGTGALGISGTGSATFASMTVVGVGSLAISGAGAATFAPMTATGTGALGISGSGSAIFDAMTAAGAGALGVSGSGASTFAAMTVAGSGTVTVPPITGSGGITFAAMLVSGTGTVVGPGGAITGSGAITFAAMTSIGSGTVQLLPPAPVPVITPRRPAISAVPLPTSPFVYPLNGNLTPVGYQFLLALMRRTGGLAGITSQLPDELLPFAAVGIGESLTLAPDVGTLFLRAMVVEAAPPAPLPSLLGPLLPPALMPPGEPLSVVPGSSPAVLQAPGKGFMLVQGGTVSALELSRAGGAYVATGLTGGFIPLDINDELRVTYTVIPNMTFFGSSTYA